MARSIVLDSLDRQEHQLQLGSGHLLRLEYFARSIFFDRLNVSKIVDAIIKCDSLKLKQ